MTESKCLKSHYIQILRDNGIHGEFTEVDIKLPQLHGDNFCSTCDYVTVHRKSGQPIEMFAKRLITNPEYSKMLKELKVFDKEAGFFNEILPELKRVVKSRVCPDTEYDLDFGPKCYLANKETIVMENLVKRGYILLDKVELQDLNEARMVIKKLAKFHAPSYIILTEESSASEMLSKYPCLEDNYLMEGSEKLLSDWLVPSFTIVTQLLETHSADGKEGRLKVLKELSHDIIAKCQAYFRISDDDICHVINHGDCWNNNMMFLKDPNTTQLTGQVFIDFQMIRVGSPNLDLGYYFYTSLKHDVRRKEWTNLLKLYYDSLGENVEALKGKIDFSFDEFVADYKRKFVPGFIFGLCMGALTEAMKGVGNLNEIEGDVMEHVNNVFKNWVENNPQLAKQNVHILIGLFDEYRELLNL